MSHKNGNGCQRSCHLHMSCPVVTLVVCLWFLFEVTFGQVVVSLVLTVVGGSWESRRRCPVPLTPVERITNRHSIAVVDHAIDLTTSLISKGVAVHMQVVLYQKDTTTQAIFMRVFLPFPPPHFPRSWGRGTRPAVGRCSCAMDLCGSPDGQTVLNCCHSGPEQQLTVGSATAPPGPGAASPGAVQHPRGMKRLGHLTSASGEIRRSRRLLCHVPSPPGTLCSGTTRLGGTRLIRGDNG